MFIIILDAILEYFYIILLIFTFYVFLNYFYSPYAVATLLFFSGRTYNL
jgi:hypothetical protein